MTEEELLAMQAKVAPAQGLEVPPEAQRVLETAQADAAAADLSNADTQKAIEFPKTMALTLFLPSGEKKCTIATEFSYEQVNDLNVFEDLQSFSMLFVDELAAYEWREGDNRTYLVALTTGRMRAAVRRILSKITTYDEPWTTKDSQGREVTHRRPTVAELSEGIRASNGEPDPVAMQRLAEILFAIYTEAVNKQKKARAAAVSL